MPRKRKSTTEEPPADTSTTATAEPPQVASDTPPTHTPDTPPAETAGRTSFAERVGPRRGPAVPDPVDIAGDCQAGVRLFESRRDHHMPSSSTRSRAGR